MNRKLQFLFAGCVVLFTAAGFWWYGDQAEELLHQRNRRDGRLLVDQAMLTKHWSALEARAEFRPFVADLSEDLTSRAHTVDVIRPDERTDQGGPKDEFEWQLLDRYRPRKPTEATGANVPEFDERLVLDRNEYHYYQPIRARQSCLTCHDLPRLGTYAGLDILPKLKINLENGTVTETEPPQLSEGDLLAIVKITLPYSPTQQALNFHRALLLGTVFAVAFAIVGVFVLLSRLDARRNNRGSGRESEVNTDRNPEG